jgi:NAD(P)-dependent dehydrogenase (short-subunit alcohol dehydrogenase family)
VNGLPLYENCSHQSSGKSKAGALMIRHGAQAATARVTGANGKTTGRSSMKRTFVITGAASGLGEAATNRLKGKGHTVIGVDLAGSDINVDLSTAQGRKDLVEQVRAAAPDGIDGIFASAGTSDYNAPGLVIAVNYFGARATFEGLHSQLRGPGSRCLAVASCANLVSSDEILELEGLCINDHEAEAVARAGEHGTMNAYPGSKRALTLWARKTSVKQEWAGSGILLNILAPGVVKTPMVARTLANPESAPILKANSPIAVNDYAEPEVAAELVDFLLNFEGNYIVGQVFYLDGGTEALKRPDRL